MTDKNITKDAMYEAVAPDDFESMLNLDRYGARSSAFDKIIAANPDKAAAVKEKPQAIGWFVGQVMKDTGGKANPAAVNEILKAKLGL